jgi:hypothetical protein
MLSQVQFQSFCSAILKFCVFWHLVGSLDLDWVLKVDAMLFRVIAAHIQPKSGSGIQKQIYGATFPHYPSVQLHSTLWFLVF